MLDTHMQFFTASILKWRPILFNDPYKKIIINSLKFLVEHKRVILYAFVVMPNHIHIIWQICEGHKLAYVQRDFLRFTGQQILKDFRTNRPELYKAFEVNLKDRRLQIWQRNPLSIDLYSRKVIEQKLDYIHHNPVQGKWNLVEEYTDYYYSSASFYEDGDERFGFLTHYMAYFGH